ERGGSNQHPALLEREDWTLVAWYPSLYAPRTGGVAYDSRHGPRGTGRGTTFYSNARGPTHMALDTPSVTKLSHAIAQVTAPSFLRGAVAAFIPVLIARMNRIIDRSQALNAISDDDVSRASLKADIPRLKRRAMILNRAIFYATVSGIVTSLLVIVAFI